MIRKYFMDLYTVKERREGTNWSITFPTLSHGDKNLLNREISEKEIESAVFQMGAFKAPGPDGLPPGFYQRYWMVVGAAVTRFVRDAFRDKRFPTHMSDTIVSLIPKVKHPECISQFRPIALANVTTKLITKIIANRVNCLVLKLVNPMQYAFMTGRQASENIIMAQELIHTMWNKRGNKRFMVIKIDLEKVYDRVNWSFLRTVLEAAGVGTNLLELIMFCVMSPSLSVVWNGQRLTPFQPSQGIRQGDPLDPYLFLLCMDVLSQMIINAVKGRSWKK